LITLLGHLHCWPSSLAAFMLPQGTSGTQPQPLPSLCVSITGQPPWEGGRQSHAKRRSSLQKSISRFQSLASFQIGMLTSNLAFVELGRDVEWILVPFILCYVHMIRWKKKKLKNTPFKVKKKHSQNVESISTPSATFPRLVSNIKLEQCHCFYPIPTKHDSITVRSTLPFYSKEGHTQK